MPVRASIIVSCRLEKRVEAIEDFWQVRVQVDAFVAGYAAEEVFDGAAVSHELMRFHQGQIDDGIGV